jgi:Endoplasmic reticulum vesicle transporter
MARPPNFYRRDLAKTVGMARRAKKPPALWVALVCVAVAAAAVWAFRDKLGLKLGLEGFVTPPNVSCYGAAGPNVICKTCDAVQVAFKKKGWTLDKAKAAQCGTPCYGARANDDCATCADVKGAHNAKKWPYDAKKFVQC